VIVGKFRKSRSKNQRISSVRTGTKKAASHSCQEPCKSYAVLSFTAEMIRIFYDGSLHLLVDACDEQVISFCF
jgi:hypothetical protein